MRLTRRAWMAGAGALPLQAGRAQAAAPSMPIPPTLPPMPLGLPAREAFAPMPVTYLDSGTMHPFSLGARQAVRSYLDARSLDGSAPRFGIDDGGERIRGKFAALINASPDEICLVQSTTAGEHLVVKALDIPRAGGRIVTDTLHFFGSFYLYEELGRQGMDVVWLRPRDGRRIEMDDIEKAITRDTRLVSVSLVSTFNGFQHDLKRICDIAHARGAYVYADIVHAAGAVPIDVRESGVDFAATASYKWLMGDFGLGFLYVRRDLLDRVKRSQFGYYQLEDFQTHVYPFDPPGAAIADCVPRKDATGHFATGTTSGAGEAQLDYSLDYIRRLGVPAIQAHRTGLLRHARSELVRRGYQPLTPEEAQGPLLTFAYKDAPSLAARLDRAKVKITLAHNRFRIAPSVFNDMADIDRLVEALS